MCRKMPSQKKTPTIEIIPGIGEIFECEDGVYKSQNKQWR